MTKAENVSDRNYRFFREFAHNEVEAKCFDYKRFTILGKTCRGKCDKEGEE